MSSHHAQAQSLPALGLTATSTARRCARHLSSSPAAAGTQSVSEHLLDPPFTPGSPALPAFAPAIAGWRRPYTPGPLSPSQLQQFYEWGYVLVRDVLSGAELKPAMAAVEQQVDELANALWKAGKLRSLCADADFFHRLTLLEQQFPSLSVLLHKQGVLPPQVCSLWGNKKLLSIAQQLLGPDLAAHPNCQQQRAHCSHPHPLRCSHSCSSPLSALRRVAAHQDSSSGAGDCGQQTQTANRQSDGRHRSGQHGRSPHTSCLLLCLAVAVSAQPWHQDAAYLDPSADETLQLTAWIPFLDATVRNGCMQVVRGGHRSGVVVPHTGCAGSTWYIEIESERMQQSLRLDVQANVVTVPVPLGSVLLLNNLIPHRSLNNASEEIRWSIDLRWQRPDKPSGYALKPLLPLTSKDEPSFSPDWEHWRKQDRHAIVKQSLSGQQQSSSADEFDTTIVGVRHQPQQQQQPLQRPVLASPPSLAARLLSQPWMSRWPLTHHNRHTRKWEELRRTGSQQEQQAAASRN